MPTVELLQTPWRNTSVGIYPASAIGVERRTGREPIPDPTTSVEVDNAGSFSVDDVGVAASVVVGEADWAVRYTAQEEGDDGEDITIAYVDPAGNDQVLAISVTGSAIEVLLATGVAGAITSTADSIKTAIEADNDADALVAVADEAPSDGTDIVEAVAATNLEDGYDGLANGEWVAAAQDPAGTWRFLGFKVH